MSKARIVILVIVILLISSSGIMILSTDPSTRITGYSGMTAKFVDIKHSYGAQEVMSGTRCTLEMDPYFFGIFEGGIVDWLLVSTSIRAELGQPQYLRTRDDWSDVIETTDEEAGQTITQAWEAHIVQMRMGVSVYTEGDGRAATEDVDFVIELTENDQSIFQEPDETAAFIIDVYTYDPTSTSDDNLVELAPSSGGHNIQYNTIESDDIPDWIHESNYDGDLENAKKVQFELSVVSISPTTFVIFPVSSSGTWYIQMDVLLFGYWEVMGEWKDWEPDDEDDLITLLIDFMIQLLWIIIGLVGTVVVFWRIKDLRIAGALAILIWIIVGWQLGFFDQALARMGFG